MTNAFLLYYTRLKGSGPCITMDSVLPSEGRYSGSIPDMGIKSKQKARRSFELAGFLALKLGVNYLAFLRSFSR